MTTQICDDIACNGFYDPLWAQVTIDGGGNTLVIPNRAQPPCISVVQSLTKASVAFHESFPSGVITHFTMFDCGAQCDGCDPTQEFFILGVGSFPGLQVSAGVGSGKLVYDSNPAISAILASKGLDSVEAHDALCPGQPIILGEFGGIPPGPPNPPPTFCTSPCVLVVQPDGSETCVCDPPLPNSLPRAFRAPQMLRQPTTRASAVTRAGVALKTALNPSLRIPKGFANAMPCGCDRNDPTVFSETLE